MKSFKQILTEAAKKSEVLLFGRMNPPTAGHEENVLAAHALAQKHSAHLQVIASHSHDPKKNPLSPAQKTKHLNRAFGHLDNTTIGTSSTAAPSILHQAVAAHKRGVRHLILVGGEDRAEGHAKLIKQYNGVEGKAHGYYKFDNISVKNTGARKSGISGTALRKHVAKGNYDAFKKNLPSRIASNERHSQELFRHVQNGLTHKEQFNREAFLSGDLFKLGESVTDSFTGLSGQVVYRGPTYVTIQIEQDLSFKRWVETVDENWMPADLVQHHLNRLHYCPGAQEQFKKLLGSETLDPGLVQTALDKTAHYLDIEEYAADNPDSIDDHMISAFVGHLRDAGQILQTLGVLPEHESYMEMHAHKMMNLIHGDASGPKEENMNNFKDFLMQEQQGETKVAQAGDEVGEHLTDDDLKGIEQHIDKLEWEDVRHLYADQEHAEMEESLELDEADLTAAQRMKKKMEFLKSKAKRNIARKIALKRMSSQPRLKKKSIVHARKMILQRLLRGRDKASLSAAEKSRIENIVSKMKGAVVRISNRLMPKLRELEQQRLKHVREDWAETGDVEAKSSQSIAADTVGDDRLERTKQRLAGKHVPAANIDYAAHNKKRKQFGHMED